MNKIFLGIICLILICFLIPILFTRQYRPKEIETEADIGDNIQNIPYDYKQYKTVKLLHSKTEEVEELNLDEYIYGVVASEMPANYEMEALKAQSIVARTYTLYSIVNNKKHENADICDNSRMLPSMDIKRR